MKKFINLVKWNFLPIVFVFGFTMAISSPHLPYWLNLLIGIIIAFSTGLATLKFKESKEDTQ